VEHKYVKKIRFVPHREHRVSMKKVSPLSLLEQQSLFIMRIMRNTQIHCVDGMSGSSALRHGKAESRSRIASPWPSSFPFSVAISAGLPGDTTLPTHCVVSAGPSHLSREVGCWLFREGKVLKLSD
jgi:hypothetical protein